MAWTEVSLEQLLAGWDQTVHFSFKYTNTNPTGGVRLGADAQLALPYLALRTVGPCKAAVDYCSSTAVQRQVLALSQGREEEMFAGVPAQLAQEARAAMALPRGGAQVGCGALPVRLRQVIVQNQQGDDLVLTPLVSAGLFKLVLDRLRQRSEAAGDGLPGALDSARGSASGARRRVRRAFLNLGGSNPFNGGALIVGMRRPLWFSAPVERRDIRRAFALHHRGISLNVSLAGLEALHMLRVRQSYTDGAGQTRCAAGGAAQLRLLRELVAPVIERAAAARATLDGMRQFLPCRTGVAATGACPAAAALNAPSVSSQLPRHMQALLDESLRYNGWKQECAYAIYLRIIGTSFRFGGKPVTLGLSETDANRVWVALIRDML